MEPDAATSPEQLLALAEQIRQHQPANATIERVRARALLDLRRPLEALQACDEAVRLDAGNLTAHATRGEALIELGRHEEALDAYAQVLRIDPRCAPALYNRVQALVRLDETRPCDETLLCALRELEQLLALEPQYPGARRIHGSMLKQLGRLDEAVASLQEAIHVNPADQDAHYGLAECRILVGDWPWGGGGSSTSTANIRSPMPARGRRGTTPSRMRLSGAASHWPVNPSSWCPMAGWVTRSTFTATSP